MAITGEVQADGKTIKITTGLRFDFNSHREFRDAYEKSPARLTQYIIDMRATEYMDSAALGMLLVLREHAGGDEAKISLSNVGAELRAIFKTSNIDRLFRFE